LFEDAGSRLSSATTDRKCLHDETLMREQEVSHELILCPIKQPSAFAQPRLISDIFGDQKRQDHKTVDEIRI
ncbi:MAG: hypothetical protein QNI94_12685, partial [Kiloniellales bacterium]|nr:hypothetical protein [Kiloniellales bacterium]